MGMEIPKASVETMARGTQNDAFVCEITVVHFGFCLPTHAILMELFMVGKAFNTLTRTTQEEWVQRVQWGQ